ncbi:MAG: hypothetical protein ABR607_17200, partial [Pyrinomonadaceae bacterium]
IRRERNYSIDSLGNDYAAAGFIGDLVSFVGRALLTCSLGTRSIEDEKPCGKRKQLECDGQRSCFGVRRLVAAIQ